MSNLASYFKRETRTNDETFYTLKDDAPEWLRAAVQEAHDDRLPDDWVYAECYASCCAIDDGSLTEDDLHGHVDGQVDIYTQKVFQWAADFCLSSLWAHAEERAEDLGDGGTLVERIQRIQYCAIESICQTILSAYENAAEEESEDA